jgi:hypothetical protein
VRDLEAIRGLSWSKPDDFIGTVGLLDDPVLVRLARASKKPVTRVNALKRMLNATANAIDRRERRNPPDLNRSDAFAARVLLRLGPNYEHMKIEDLQGMVATSWKKRNRSTGEFEQLTAGGFRKQQQSRFYQRLAEEVRTYLARASTRGQATRKNVPVELEQETSQEQLVSLWKVIKPYLTGADGSGDGPPHLVEAVRHLDQLIRKQLIVPQEDTADVMAKSMMAYACELHQAGRDSALVAFRSNISLTLHITGQHGVRVDIGELALESATALENELAQAEILVDDLGWGNYMSKNPTAAIESIEAGRKLAKEALRAAPARKMDLSITIAKAIRHAAIIKSEQGGFDCHQELLDALQLLEGIRPRTEIVAREVAQVFHARALVTAIYFSIDDHGKLPRPLDDDGRTQVSEALKDVRKSAKMFKKLGDQARYTKALFLEVRLLEASGQSLEARQVRVLRDRALAASDWSRPDRVTTLSRV